MRLALCAVLLLGGCVSQSGLPPEPASWPERRAHFQALADFDLKGKMALARAGDGFNGRVNWRQRGEQFELRLSGPLGAGSVTLSGDTRGVLLDGPDGQRRFADPAAAAAGELGVAIPLTALRYWVLGVPEPFRAADETVDAQLGRLDALRQHGWDIAYLGYAEWDGRVLPRKLELRHDDARLRLVISRFELP